MANANIIVLVIAENGPLNQRKGTATILFQEVKT